jgi:vancomycin resistance protein VanJ
MSSIFKFYHRPAVIGRCLLFIFYFLFSFSLISLIIPPHVFWICEVATLLIPVLVAINCALLLLFLFLWKRTLLKWVSGVFFLLSFFYFQSLYRINPQLKTEQSDCDFSILSYNVSGFNSTDKPDYAENLSTYIAQYNSDIVCLQEYLPENGLFLDSLYPYQVVSAKKNIVGVTIFSKYPVIQNGLVFEGQSEFNKGLYADILINGRILRVVSVHFESNNLKKRRTMLKNAQWLKKTSKIRSIQVAKLLSLVDSTSIPLVVAGDFNETPYSYLYMQMKKKLKNSFEEKGKGFGFTYLPPKAFLRIDHQFFDPNNVAVNTFQTLNPSTISDHLPILGCYRFSQQP